MKNSSEKPEKIGKVAMVSGDVENENLQKLRDVFPTFVKDGVIDFDELQAFFKKEGVLAGTEKYGLSWAGKSKAFADIRRTATSTLSPLSDESKNWDTTENIFIEGENLEVLKLLQKKYANPGKIKMIYIDPPYNTGKDFIYTDNFTENKNEYYERTGQNCGGIKLTSNPESNGRYHSDWLTMMYPRLFLARNLLRDDGVIFVSIDDNEVANLRMIMDEIFGEENFVTCFTWRRTDNQPNIGNLAKVKEYIMCYSKSESNLRLNKMLLTERAKKEYRYEDEKGKFRRSNLYDKTRGRYAFNVKAPGGKILSGPWMVQESEFTELQKEGNIYWATGEEETPYGKIYLHESEGQIPSDFLGIEFGTNQEAGLDLQDLFEGKRLFDFPKPISLIKHFITIGSGQNDIILDFFAGSGTTAYAVMDLNSIDSGNRKWICVQVPEGTGDDSEACKAGYKTISQLSMERIRRAGAKIGKGDVGFKAFSLSPSNYSEWNVLTDKDDEKTLLQQAKLFAEQPLVAGYDEKSVVYEILLKEGYELNSKIADVKKGRVDCYHITDGDKEMTITFAKKLTKDQVDGLGLPKDTTFVCLDSALDDTTKVNIARNLMVKTI